MLKKIIALEGLKITAPVGFYAYERKKKNTFIIDISVTLLWENVSDNDVISNTFNYEKMAGIVRTEMKKECKLIEDVAHRIFESLIQTEPASEAIDIIVRKKNPPIKPGSRFSKVELHWKK